MKRTMGILAVVLVLLVNTIGVAQAVSIGPAAEYDPTVNAADFSTNITNPYFSIPVGKKMVYESQTPDGLERIEVLVPGWTKEVMGVETLVFWDRVWVEGQIVEDTRDYLAQHTGTGDVWYFGEHVDNYDHGTIKDHHGSWIAGVNGAKPGIWMLANPQAGDEFRNEYYAGEAEDITKILSVNETVTAPLGTYTGCVKTLDWSPLFKATANKYYCPQVGGTAVEVDLQGPETPVEQRTELVSVEADGAIGTRLAQAYVDEGVVVDTTTTSAKTITVGTKKSGNDDNTALMTAAIIGALILVLVVRHFMAKRPSQGSTPTKPSSPQST